GFINVPLNRILTRATGIPSFLHHDAHLAALGEHRRGAAKGASELIYVTVSTGIGAGLMLRGKLYAGAHGIAGEVGHIVVQTAGTYLGIALGTLVNLFNPEVIVLGGSVLKAGAPLLQPMRRSLTASSWKASRRGLRIVRPALGGDAGLIGAVEFARLRARNAL